MYSRYTTVVSDSLSSVISFSFGHYLAQLIIANGSNGAELFGLESYCPQYYR